MFVFQDLQQEYGLKSKATVLSRNVWDILMLLPTNPHIATQFHDLKSDVSDATNPHIATQFHDLKSDVSETTNPHIATQFHDLKSDVSETTTPNVPSSLSPVYLSETP